MDERVVTNHELEEDTFEKSIRPDSFDEYIGQTKVKESIEFVNNNPLQAGAYGEELKIPIKPQILSKAIKRCNLKFIEIDKFKQNYEYFFDILYNYNNEAVGGTVPDESIYH